MSCSVDADSIMSVIHNKAGTEHESHKCSVNGSTCTCYCKVEGENVVVSADGSLFDATTGASYTGFSLAAAAEVSGVTIEVANTNAFQTAFKSGLSNILSVSVSDIGITGVSATSRRRLIGATAGVSVDYIVYASSAAALTAVADTTVASADVVTAIKADYAGPADLSTFNCVVPDLSTLGCTVSIPSCPSSESQPTYFIDTDVTTSAACTARAQTAIDVCFTGSTGQTSTATATFKPTSTVTKADSAECYIHYSSPCKAGVSLTSGRVHDFDPEPMGHAVGDFVANRYSHGHCGQAALTQANLCYDPSNPGTVTSHWVRWGADDRVVGTVTVTAPSCSDGVHNQDETNIDCGGTCLGEHVCEQLTPMVDNGGNGCSALAPCPTCQGDCDDDSQCIGDLKCFQRSWTEKYVDLLSHVPAGCVTTGAEATHNDFCYNPAYMVDKGGSGCSSSNPCPACHGDCDEDSDCIGDLVCFQRDSGEAVPGCIDAGGTQANHDFCYDPAS
jgi:hypothetical protein